MKMLHSLSSFIPHGKMKPGYECSPRAAAQAKQDSPAGQNAEASEEDDRDGVGSTQQPVVVEGPRYPLTQLFSQGHPQPLSPSCHPQAHQGAKQIQHVQHLQGTVSPYKQRGKKVKRKMKINVTTDINITCFGNLCSSSEERESLYEHRGSWIKLLGFA